MIRIPGKKTSRIDTRAHSLMSLAAGLSLFLVGTGCAISPCPVAVHAKHLDTGREAVLYKRGIETAFVPLGQFGTMLRAIIVDVVDSEKLDARFPTTGAFASVVSDYHRLILGMAAFGALDAQFAVLHAVSPGGAEVGSGVSLDVSSVSDPGLAQFHVQRVPPGIAHGTPGSTRHSGPGSTSAAFPVSQALPIKPHA